MNYHAAGFQCPKCRVEQPMMATDDGKGRRIYVLVCPSCGNNFAIEMAHGGGFVDKRGRLVQA